jgi:hypothetical protein
MNRDNILKTINEVVERKRDISLTEQSLVEVPSEDILVLEGDIKKNALSIDDLNAQMAEEIKRSEKIGSNKEELLNSIKEDLAKLNIHVE